ncbi:hypothetical protein, partial [Paraburkholderia dipogonis]
RATLVPGVMLENRHLYVSIELSFPSDAVPRDESTYPCGRNHAVKINIGHFNAIVCTNNSI